METEVKETIAQEAKRLLEPIPDEEWTVGLFSNGINKCCGIGHYVRLKSNNPLDFSEQNCDDFIRYQTENKSGCSLRFLSGDFFVKVHGKQNTNIASVNNNVFFGHELYQIYSQETPKKRVMALLDDMIKAGF